VPAAGVADRNAAGVPDASRAAEKHKKQRDEAQKLNERFCS
jgi:hypothetical protein